MFILRALTSSEKKRLKILHCNERISTKRFEHFTRSNHTFFYFLFLSMQGQSLLLNYFYSFYLINSFWHIHCQAVFLIIFRTSSRIRECVKSTSLIRVDYWWKFEDTYVLSFLTRYFIEGIDAVNTGNNIHSRLLMQSQFESFMLRHFSKVLIWKKYFRSRCP